jgi:hypothetical protein
MRTHTTMMTMKGTPTLTTMLRRMETGMTTLVRKKSLKTRSRPRCALQFPGAVKVGVSLLCVAVVKTETALPPPGRLQGVFSQQLCCARARAGYALHGVFV